MEITANITNNKYLGHGFTQPQTKGKKSEGHHYWGKFFHGTQNIVFYPA
jgi:hypothetical protein